MAAGAALAGVLLLSAACSSDRKAATPTPSPVLVTQPPGTPAAPAAPTAAGVSGTPLVPASRTPGPAGTDEAEAQTRRVVLLPTDLPNGSILLGPITFTAEGMANHMADSAGYRERTARFRRLAGSIGSVSSPGGLAAGAVVMRYATEDGARDDLAERERTGLGGTADDQFIFSPSLTVPNGAPPAQVLVPPPAGERALRWVWTPVGSVTPATTIAFQRGAMMVVVTAIGGADAEALARALDTRAQAAQR